MGPIGCAETTVRNYTILRCVKSQKMALVCCAVVHRVSRIHEYRKDRAIKSRMRWAGHVARMRESRGVYRILVEKPEGKRPLGRRRLRGEDNIKMDLQEVGCRGHGLDRSG